ncbi:MAG: DMT family transporter [Brevibacterium yomogidense]
MEAKTLRVAALTAIAPIAWGSTYFVTRQWLPDGIPLTGAALRALPAGLLLLLLTRRLPHGDWWWRTAAISLLTVGGFFVLIYVAGTRLPSGVAATLMASSALVVVVLARLLLGERARARTYAGAVLGIVGVALLVNAAAGGLDRWGVAASLLAMLSSSLGFVLTKRWEPPVGPMTFTAWQLTCGGLLLVPVALVIEGVPEPFAPAELIGFAYLTLIATAVAYVIWFRGLSLLPAGTVGIIGLFNPLAGAMLGIAVAGERLSAGQTAGALLIVVAVVLGIRWGSGPRARGPRRRVSVLSRIYNSAVPKSKVVT